jgi:hypothetical protein
MTMKLIAAAALMLCSVSVTALAEDAGTAQGSSTAVHGPAAQRPHQATRAPGVDSPITEPASDNDAMPAASVTMTGKIEQDRKRSMRDRDHDYDSDNN